MSGDVAKAEGDPRAGGTEHLAETGPHPTAPLASSVPSQW